MSDPMSQMDVSATQGQSGSHIADESGEGSVLSTLQITENETATRTSPLKPGLEHVIDRKLLTENFKRQPRCKTQEEAIKSFNAHLDRQIRGLLSDLARDVPIYDILYSTVKLFEAMLPEMASFLGDQSPYVKKPVTLRNLCKESPGGGDWFETRLHPTINQRISLQCKHSCLLVLMFKLLAEHLLQGSNTATRQSHASWMRGDEYALRALEDAIATFDKNWLRLGKDRRVLEQPDLWVEVLMARALLHLAEARRSLADDSITSNQSSADEQQQRFEKALDEMKAARMIAGPWIWSTMRTKSKMRGEIENWGKGIFWNEFAAIESLILAYKGGSKESRQLLEIPFHPGSDMCGLPIKLHQTRVVCGEVPYFYAGL